MDLAVSSYPQTYERTPGIARPTKDVWTPHPSPANEEATSCGRAFVISGHTRFTHELRFRLTSVLRRPSPSSGPNPEPACGATLVSLAAGC